MRALGLPNTKHFHEITKIEDALARKFLDRYAFGCANLNLAPSCREAQTRGPDRDLRAGDHGGARGRRRKRVQPQDVRGSQEAGSHLTCIAVYARLSILCSPYRCECYCCPCLYHTSLSILRVRLWRNLRGAWRWWRGRSPCRLNGSDGCLQSMIQLFLRRGRRRREGRLAGRVEWVAAPPVLRGNGDNNAIGMFCGIQSASEHLHLTMKCIPRSSHQAASSELGGGTT